MSIKRKLAAIMFTDIAGSTAQMSKDEAVAISLLNKKESILKPLIDKHNGTYVKSTGDGSLSHFNSAVDAATCAKIFQETIYDDKDLNVRVGVHLGDTIFEKGDIRGEGVNIASRLESMAIEGGVFVSKEVHDQLANQKGFEAVSLGLQSMKGVGRLIEVYGLKGDKLSEPNLGEYQDDKVDKHSDDEVPSIAIIPFRNKGKKEDAFYAYGICADLISDCSSAGLIRVTSLEEIEEFGAFSFKEKAKKLDVRYMTTGNLWKMDDMFQLSIELFDTKKSKVIWSDRWQEKWDNLPSIKGSLSDGLLKALDTKKTMAKMFENTNSEAYEYYLKAKYKFLVGGTIEELEIARGLTQKAIELDDNLLIANNQLGWYYLKIDEYDKGFDNYKKALDQSKKAGNKQVTADSLLGIGRYYAWIGEYDKEIDYITRSLKLYEELDDKKGVAKCLSDIGKHEKALNIYKEIDYKRGIEQEIESIGNNYLNNGDYDTALDYFTRSNIIKEEMSYRRGTGRGNFFVGCVYEYKGDLDTALEYFTRSLSIRKEIGNKAGVGGSFFAVGRIFFLEGAISRQRNILKNQLNNILKLDIRSIDF